MTAFHIIKGSYNTESPPCVSPQPFVSFLLQALLFYTPRYIWKTFEGGKIKMLVSELNSPIVDEDVKKSRLDTMVDYFSINLHHHNYYAMKYIACEVLNFVNVIGQIFFTDR